MSKRLMNDVDKLEARPTFSMSDFADRLTRLVIEEPKNGLSGHLEGDSERTTCVVSVTIGR